MGIAVDSAGNLYIADELAHHDPQSDSGRCDQHLPSVARQACGIPRMWQSIQRANLYIADFYKPSAF